MSPVKGISETVLYVDDMHRSIEFDQRGFGFAVLTSSYRLAALRVAPLQVLLIAGKGATVDAKVTPRGTAPPHNGSRQLHVAFSFLGLLSKPGSEVLV